jgi:hypothetical protein
MRLKIIIPVFLLFLVPSLSASSQQTSYDLSEKELKNLTIGMTYDEVVQTLQAQGIQLEPNKRRGLVKSDVGALYKLDFPGGSKEYYLIQEAEYQNEDGKTEVLRVGFSYPLPDKPQQLVEVYYKGRLGEDVTVDEMVEKIKSRYGEPDKSWLGAKGKAELRYGTFKSHPNFPLWAAKMYKPGNVGIDVSIYTAESSATYPGFVIHMGNDDMFFARSNEVAAIQKAAQDAAEENRVKDKSVSDF